jgi:hypothetical protein
MADDLLAKAQEIQRRKLLEQAQAIQAKQTHTMPDGTVMAGPSMDEGAAPQEDGGKWAGLKKGIDLALRGLDYPGGLLRTGVAGIAGVATPSDVGAALKGQAPHSAEYMQRAGLPEGDVVNYPLVGDVSSRDLAGFAADVATDPLTALSRAGKFGMNAVDVGAAKAGKALFKSGLKKIDQAVLEKGAKPFSEIALEKGLTGSVGKIRDASEQLLKDTKAGRDILHEAADTAGAVVDPKTAFKDALDKTIKMGERDPGLRELADKLKDKINLYIEHGPVPLSQASEWKTNLYNALPESAYDKFGRMKGPAERIHKSLANGLKNSIEAAGNSVVPGLGDKIGQANETMQTLLTARKPLKTAAKAAKNINAVTSVDAMLAAGTAAASHNPLTTAGVVALKKAADISKSTAFRTKAGKALMDVSERGGLTPAASQLLQSPWLGLKEKK